MARFVDAIDLPLSPEAAFDLLADFSRLPEWDPGAVEARRLGSGPIARGSRFRVVSEFLGRRVPLTYEIVEYERPLRLVLRARDGVLTSLDEINFAARAGGTRVTYDARLALSGIAQLGDPLLQLAFGFLGRAAVRGLETRAAALATQAARDGARLRSAASAG
jgi:hypothetical protein